MDLKINFLKNNKFFLYFFVFSLLLSMSSFQRALAATDQSAPTESEVLVVYNSAYTTDSDSSGLQDSQQIAEYYKSKRPGVTVVGLAMPTTEEITWDQYNTQVKAPLENYLTTNNLVDAFKVIVTVKGVPLKIMGDSANNVSKITPGGSSSIFASTDLNPYAMTIDASGNLYTANYYSNDVTKITSAGVSSTLGTTGSHPRGIVVDASGNVYTANYSDNNVTKITPAGVSSTLGTTGNYPYAITIDSSGNIYTANNGSSNVTKITPAGVSSILGTTSPQPYAITIDPAGNIYTANSGGSINNVTKITPAGVSSILGTTGPSPRGITIDSSGNIYTANQGLNNVTKITPAGVSSTLGTTGNNPLGIIVDPSDNVYTANYSDNNVTKITAAGVSSIFATGVSGPSGIVIDASGNIYTANAHGHNNPWAPECGTYCYDMNYAAVDAGISLSYQDFKTTGRHTNPYYNTDPSFLKNDHFKNNYFTTGGFTLKYLVSRLDGYTVSDIENMIDRGINADKTGVGYWVLDAPNGGGVMRAATARDKLLSLNKNVIYDSTASYITTSANSIMGYSSYGYNTGMGDGYVSNNPVNANHLDFTLLPGAVFSTYESYNAWGFISEDQAPETVQGQLGEWIQIGGTGGIGNTYEPWSSAIANESIWMPSYAVGYPWVEAAYMSMPYMGFVQIVLGDPLMTIVDTTSPAAVSNMQITQTVGGTANLTWTNPTDPDLAGVKIVRKTGSYPTNFSDGTLVYNGLLSSVVDSGLTNGTTYYYAAFAYDAVPNYSILNSDSKVSVLIDTVAPSPVSNMQITQIVGGTANLTWTNPSDPDLTGVKIVRKTGSYPTNFSDGTLVYNGLLSSVIDSGLTNGTTYYYAAFAYDAVPNYSILNSDSKVSVLIDTVAPSPASNMQATAGNTSASLTWTNPTDPDLAGVKIVRKTGSYPTNITDGLLVYDGSLASLSNQGLNNGTTYYYAAFAYDAVPNYSILNSDSKISVTPYQPSGGGGGGNPIVIYCTSVTYSDWSTTCLNNKQYRSILSSSPSSCTQTTAQQLAMQKDCGIVIPVVPETSLTTGTVSVIEQITSEAVNCIAGRFEEYVTAFGGVIDNLGQKQAAKKYSNITGVDNKATTETKDLVIDFIFYGTPSTKILGEGERAGVVNSYLQVHEKLPNLQTDWQDILKIANGRWPSQRLAVAETKSATFFKKVYGRQPNLKNNIDENAVMVMTYGLIPAKRNLQSEAVAIKAYKFIYKKAPKDSLSWNIVRAIAYSGAAR
jgi:uncharacterized protein (TIGR03790 family)